MDKVISLIQELTGIRNVSLSANLQNELGMDSFGLVALLISIEDTFCIQLKEVDMNPFDLNTVTDVIRLVEQYYE